MNQKNSSSTKVHFIRGRPRKIKSKFKSNYNYRGN